MATAAAAAAAPGDDVSIYVEFLPHIRQLSLAASIPRAAASDIAVQIVDGGAALQVRHGGQTIVSRLPARAAAPSRAGAGAGAREQVPVSGTVTLPVDVTSGASSTSTWRNWRVPAVADASFGQRPDANAAGDDDVPWSARYLPSGEAGLACRGCGAEIVSPGRIKSWKDLPSENWAEMMEFWHCHKPDLPPRPTADQKTATNSGESPRDVATGANGHSQPACAGSKADEESLAQRGYGSQSTIGAQMGVGLVDIMAFIFDEGDCVGITYSESTFQAGFSSAEAAFSAEGSSCHEGPAAAKSLNLFCTNCRCSLGFFSARTAAVTLLKWQCVFADEKQAAGPLLPGSRSPSPPLPTISNCVAARLISALARTGSSKSVILPLAASESRPRRDGDPHEQVLHLWILNGLIGFSAASTAAGTRGPGPAIKLLYKMVSRAEADRMLDSLTSDVQDVWLPGGEGGSIDELLRALQASTLLLPNKERDFKGWKAGLLERWEEGQGRQG